MTTQKRFVGLSVAMALCLFSILSSPASADFLNPGFEAGGALPTDWVTFAGGSDTVERNSDMPRTGNFDLMLQTNSDTAGFSGAYQEFAISPGDLATFSIWAKVDDMADGMAGIDDDGDPNTQMRMRFEWRAGGTGSGDPNEQINLMSAITGAYTQFSIDNIVAPAGVDAVRAVVVLNRNDDKFYFDDASFSIVPEPASFGLLLLGGVCLLGGRKRSL